MHHCPKCKSNDIHRSRAKSKWEGWRKKITGRRPFRCRACGWRGWGVDFGQTFGERNLKDADLLHDERRRRDINLNALDTLEPIDEKRD